MHNAHVLTPYPHSPLYTMQLSILAVLASTLCLFLAAEAKDLYKVRPYHHAKRSELLESPVGLSW